MPKAPDFLLNMTNSDPNLVEDSPQFRAREARDQMANLHSAANEAMDAVRQQTEQSRAETARHQLASLDAITPAPNPLQGPDTKFFGPEDAQPATDDAGTGDMASAGHDPVASVMRISSETGIPPQQVAAMALLGRDIGKLEQARGPMTPPPPADMPQPLLPAPGGATPPPAGPEMPPPAPLPGPTGGPPTGPPPQLPGPPPGPPPPLLPQG